MNAVLVSDSDFDAFCLDHFPEVKERFTNGMDRVQKANLLIERASSQRILENLREHNAGDVTRQEHLLSFEEAPVGDEVQRAPAPEALAAVRNELTKLLSLSFTQTDLRQFLGSGPGGQDVLSALPTDIEGKTQFVTQAVETLLRRDLVNTEFFARLLRERANRAADIDSIRAQWTEVTSPEPGKQGASGLGVHEVSPVAGPSDAPAPPPRTEEATAPASWGKMSARAAVGAALRLDRSMQWAKVLETCQRERHAFFLLYGQSRQSLYLFLDRIAYYLTEESGRPHGVFRVPFKHEHSFASSGAEWELHVSLALAPGQRGTAANHLADAAQRQSLLLILGKRPLHHLTSEQERGLKEFICVNLPNMLEAAQPSHPVRTLIAVDFDEKADSLEPKVDEWALEAERRGVLDYCALSEVKFPTWDEVEGYLRELRPRPSPEVISKIKSEFDAIVSTDQSTFQQLAERLDRHLLMDI